jgi:hypothetical protein
MKYIFSLVTLIFNIFIITQLSAQHKINQNRPSEEEVVRWFGDKIHSILQHGDIFFDASASATMIRSDGSGDWELENTTVEYSGNSFISTKYSFGKENPVFQIIDSFYGDQMCCIENNKREISRMLDFSSRVRRIEPYNYLPKKCIIAIPIKDIEKLSLEFDKNGNGVIKFSTKYNQIGIEGYYRNPYSDNFAKSLVQRMTGKYNTVRIPIEYDAQELSGLEERFMKALKDWQNYINQRIEINQPKETY